MRVTLPSDIIDYSLDVQPAPELEYNGYDITLTITQDVAQDAEAKFVIETIIVDAYGAELENYEFTFKLEEQLVA